MPKSKKYPTLKSIEMTNGEYGQLQEIYGFLEFLQENKIPMPDVKDKKAIDLTFARFILYDRYEAMKYISELRVKRGEKPLSKALLKRFKDESQI
jgi:hypothetical protein